MQTMRRERRIRKPHHRRERSCGGKVRFRDHEEAVAFLHRALNARQCAELDGAETTHRAVRAYDCSTCHGVHVTSQAEWCRS